MEQQHSSLAKGLTQRYIYKLVKISRQQFVRVAYSKLGNVYSRYLEI